MCQTDDLEKRQTCTLWHYELKGKTAYICMRKIRDVSLSAVESVCIAV